MHRLYCSLHSMLRPFRFHSFFLYLSFRISKQFIFSIFFWDFDFCCVHVLCHLLLLLIPLYIFSIARCFDIWIKHQVCCAIIFVWFLMRSGEWVQYTQASEDFIYVIWMGTTQFSLGKFSFALRLSFLSPICIEPHVYQTQLQVHFNVHQRWWCTHFSGYQRGSIRLHRCACVWFALDS